MPYPTPTHIVLAATLVSAPLHAGVIFTDTFSGSGSPGAAWVTDTNGDSTLNATVNVSGGALNVNTGSVSGLTVARHTLELTGTGAPTLTLASDWTVESVVTIADASAFATMAAGEGAGVTMGVRNNLPATADKAQINFVTLNFGSGADFAVRGAHDTDGVTTENISNLGSASSPLTATIRMAYDAGLHQILYGMNTGAGFFELVSPVDTSAWSLGASDPLLIQFELGLVKFSGAAASSTFSIEDGEVSVDEFTIYDETLPTNTVPEPASALFSFLGAGALLLRRRER
ncbi:MAG: PEP-CTERM sorting domain-containing protein [Akkermansiaceae bacterium]|nr:PEP-CTERM sorting domain-containing protein [Akkermansiaceae bacterium]